MDERKAIVLCIFLVFLIIISSFFSAAETAMMAINRYRLRHQARQKKKSAMLILQLLKRPDRLLGVVLVGNTLANILMSAIATVLTIHWLGEGSLVLTTLLLTLVILVFSETAPKTIAALYPDQVARIIAYPIYILRQVFYPFIWFVNILSNGLLRLMGLQLTRAMIESLTHEELRTVIFETTGRIPERYQTMLLGILDLNKLTVNDVMVSRLHMKGLDLNLAWPDIYERLSSVNHASVLNSSDETLKDWIVLYRENINQTIGIIYLRDLATFLLTDQDLTLEKLLTLKKDPYFIPELTPLNIQLHNFQERGERVAFIVDEYGEILGFITLDDILEEIVGEFSVGITEIEKMIKIQADGSYLVDGMIPLREFNRFVKWHLPTKGPRTLSGLITETLEMLPRPGIGLLIAGYPVEIIEVRAKRVKVARVFPRQVPHMKSSED